MRWGFNLFPAFRGTGGRITYIAGDFREARVRLPLNWRTRNYVGTMITIPGVSKPRRQHSEFFNSQDSMSTEINGQSDAQNNFQIEGISPSLDEGAKLTSVDLQLRARLVVAAFATSGQSFKSLHRLPSPRSA